MARMNIFQSELRTGSLVTEPGGLSQSMARASRTLYTFDSCQEWGVCCGAVGSLSKHGLHSAHIWLSPRECGQGQKRSLLSLGWWRWWLAGRSLILWAVWYWTSPTTSSREDKKTNTYVRQISKSESIPETPTLRVWTGPGRSLLSLGWGRWWLAGRGLIMWAWQMPQGWDQSEHWLAWLCPPCARQ